MKDFTDEQERDRFFTAYGKMPNDGDMRWLLFPIQLPSDFRQLLCSLDFSFEVETRLYTTPDIPSFGLKCLWSTNGIGTFNELFFGEVQQGKFVGLPFNGKYDLKRSVEGFSAVLSSAGFDIEVIKRRRKLRALIS